MKRIRISLDNAMKMQTGIDDVQNNAIVRVLNYIDVVTAAGIAESKLENILPKKDREGVSATVRPLYEKFEPQYRGVPEHTECFIERGKRYWYIIGVMRTAAERSGSVRVKITPHSIERKGSTIINYLSKNLKGNFIGEFEY